MIDKLRWWWHMRTCFDCKDYLFARANAANFAKLYEQPEYEGLYMKEWATTAECLVSIAAAKRVGK